MAVGQEPPSNQDGPPPPKQGDGPPKSGNFDVTLSEGLEPQLTIIPAKGPHTEEELQLKSQIESALTTLRTIPTLTRTDAGKQRLNAYLKNLTWIAKAGLEPSGDAKLASLAIKSFQTDVLWREGPLIKNDYMRTLGLWAFALSLIAVLLYIVIDLVPLGLMPLWFVKLVSHKNLLLIWIGAMIGSWLSFGVRRVEFSFIDLGRPEADMLDPQLRLIFTGLLALTLSVIFLSGMIKIEIGGLKTIEITNHVIAILVGLFCGIGEQALPNAIGKRASQFLDEVGK